jgi:hypothetical protein
MALIPGSNDPNLLPGGGVIPITTNQNVPGGKGFEDFLNGLRNSKLTGIGVAAPIAYGAGSLMQGELLRGAGEIGGGVLGAKLSGGAAKAAETALSAMGARGKLAAPIVGGAIRIAGGLFGGNVGGGVTNALGGSVANAAQAVTSAVTGARREEGKSGLTGGGVEITDKNLKDIAELSRITGRSQVEIAREMLPLQEQFRNNETQRTMQLNQQNAQLTGALNRQMYTAQLAGGAQSQAGETVRTMMTAPNPYAQSAFQYRG